MAKILIYQGFSAIFEIFSTFFFEFEGMLLKIKELTKRMPLFPPINCN